MLNNQQMVTLNHNTQRIIESGFDTAPLAAVAISGKAKYTTGNKIQITEYIDAEINAIRQFDGLLIDGVLYIVSQKPDKPNGDVVVLISISQETLPGAPFADEDILWAKGNGHSEYPHEGWSLSSEDYSVDGIHRTQSLNFGKHQMVLVEANTPVIVSSATAFNSLAGVLESDTYSNWLTKMQSGTLPICKDIIVTDRGDLGFRLKTNKTGDGFELQGAGGFLNYDYDNSGNNVSESNSYSGIFDLTGIAPNIVIGQWIRDQTEMANITYESLTGANFVNGQNITGQTSGATAKVIYDNNSGTLNIIKTNITPFALEEQIDNGEGSTANVVTSEIFTTLTNGDIVFWNNSHYQVLDVTLLNSTSPDGNTDAYYVLPKASNNAGYVQAWDIIEYYFEWDYLIKRQDGNSTIYGSENIDNFPWGNYDISVRMDNDGNYVSVKNSIGQITGEIIGKNSSVDIRENTGTYVFSVSGTYQNIYEYRHYGTTEIHLQGFSAGVYSENSRGNCRAYINANSYLNKTGSQDSFNFVGNLYGGSNVNTQYSSAYTKADFYDSVVVDIHGGAGSIIDGVFAKGNYTVILNTGVTHSKCEYTHSGTFTFPSDINFTGKELSNNGSSFNAIVDTSVAYNPENGVLTLPDWAGVIKLIHPESVGVIQIGNFSTSYHDIPVLITKETNGTYYQFMNSSNFLNKNYGNPILYIDFDDYIEYRYKEDNHTYQLVDFYSYD